MLGENVALRVLADCPRCGGWARKLDAASARWTCRGCRWTGFVSL